MSGYFIFNGFDTRTVGVDVYPAEIDIAPAREFKVIPGHGINGNIIVDQRRYSNVDRSYWVLIPSDFDSKYEALRQALLPPTGYCRLEDSWFPDEYYLAYVNNPFEPVTTRVRDMGKVLVTFNRKPQRWLKSGEAGIDLQLKTMSSGDTYYTTEYFKNPTSFTVYPRLVYKIDPDAIAAFSYNAYRLFAEKIADSFDSRGQVNRYHSHCATIAHTNTVRPPQIMAGIEDLSFDASTGIVTTNLDTDINRYLKLTPSSWYNPSNPTSARIPEINIPADGTVLFEITDSDVVATIESVKIYLPYYTI